MKYDGNNQLFIARFEDGVWKRMRLIRWNCRWHIQGWGSRPTELGIGTPKVAEDRKSLSDTIISGKGKAGC
ncbi:MAG: hypothetical protein Q4F08_00520 [Rikenellaceae bacterium]|nr:hypothetical protein [uncultured Alistipes sp.]MDO5383329.1 hypothetical protein [Rikenellaceae bacterium]